MRQSTLLRVLLAGSVAVCLTAFGAGTSSAAERAWDFLNGLRQRGYHDMALEYLDQMAKSPDCPEDLKQAIDYEAGVTLVTGSRAAPSTEAREQQLDDARDRLQKFLREHPDHLMAATANTQLANVLVERGRISAELAAQPGKPAAENTRLMTEARKHYQAAKKVFENAERQVYEKAKSLQGFLDPNKDAEKIKQRDQTRSDYIQAKLFLAGVVYEIGKSYPTGSDEFKKNLNEAAAQYYDLFDKYGTLVAGLHARMWEGRMYKELGNTVKATAVLKEMMTLPDEPEAFRRLKDQSLALLMEVFLAPKVKNYLEAISKMEEWQKEARGSEESSLDGLSIHYSGGNAALQYSETLEANDPKRNQYRASAKRHFEFVAKFAGEHQRDARTKLLGLSGESNGAAPEPTNYVEAKDRGDFAWGNMVVAMGQLPKAKNAQERNKATQNMNKARDEAAGYYRMALGLAMPNVSLDDLNMVRFRLSYLYFIADRLYESALLGEFLAKRYPGAAGARKGGEIAVKAYRKLFTEALNRGDDTTFETERMKRLAGYITTVWKGEPEAQEAWMMLIDTAVDNRDLELALEHLEQIAPDSPQRGKAELRTGQALWAAYLNASALPEDERPSQEELDQMIQKAQQTLKNGIQRMQKAAADGTPVSYTLVYSVLSLVQIYIGAGQSDEAAKWLDDPEVGPMTLVGAGAKVLDGHDQFTEDTYKAALQAYVGAEKLDKAEAAMNALEKMTTAGGDAEANRRLTQIYIRLGRELQEQLTRLRNENKTTELERVSQGFELFLKKISDREEGNNFSSLHWVAETFFGLGAGLNPGGTTLPAEAKQHYTNAALTYKKILNRIKADPDFAPAGADISIVVRLAGCLRALGAYEDAMKLLVLVLRQREKRIDVQIEAAQTYQDWGKVREGYYEKAIIGGQEVDGSNLVWGWGGISARVAAYYDKYTDVFHQARYNLAFCRRELALTKTGSEKTEMLKQAELDITRVFRLYPDMGGPEWFTKYDKLLITIQKLLAEKGDGLKGESGYTGSNVPASGSSPAAPK